MLVFSEHQAAVGAAVSQNGGGHETGVQVPVHHADRTQRGKLNQDRYEHSKSPDGPATNSKLTE